MAHSITKSSIVNPKAVCLFRVAIMAEMHTHLIPASYHRVTATGAAQKLLNGEMYVANVK